MSPPTAETDHSRLTLGIAILLIVDLIWVASSELTENLFVSQHYSKPFFTTYTKTSMFILFLPAFLFYRPWRERILRRGDGGLEYGVLDSGDGSDSEEPCQSQPDLITQVVPGDNEPGGAGTGTNSTEHGNPLSPPVYVPLNKSRLSSSRSRTNSESDDSGAGGSSLVRSVRFNKLAEVRVLSPSEALDAIYSRLSYTASLEALRRAEQERSRLSVQETARLALKFCVLWFVANYSYQVALAHAEASPVNILSSTSSLFTLVMAAVFPANSSSSADKFSISKLIGAVLSVGGVICISYSSSTAPPAESGLFMMLGPMAALTSALFYSIYLVFLRYQAGDEQKLDIPMFFGFLGLFNLLLLWPLFPILHYAQLEAFEWPNSTQLYILLLNGFIGTLFSEVLWIWGSFLTSSLLATLSLSLTIPLSMMADVWVKHVHYSALFYIGSLPILASFVLVSLLAHYGEADPVLDCLTYSARRIGILKSQTYTRVLANEDISSTESLIGINHSDEEEEEFLENSPAQATCST